MKKLFVFVLMSMLLVSVVAAKVDNNQNNDCSHRWFCSNGFNSECQNFFNNTKYYTIEKWSYTGSNYKVDEKNGIYNRFNINVDGNLKAADWTSNLEITAVLVKAGNDRVEFLGGLNGSVNSTKDISHITFCGYNNGNNGGSIGNNGGGSNGVPEFPAFTVGAAVLVVTLGLIFLRKN